MRLSRRYGAVGAPSPLVGASECDGTGFGVKLGAPFKASKTKTRPPRRALSQDKREPGARPRELRDSRRSRPGRVVQPHLRQ
jgi:hypothetical protein